MVVSSRPPDDAVKLDVLTRLPSDSRIAFEIDAVSPLRNASKIRNFFTEASIETVLSCGGGGAAIVRAGVCCKLEVDLMRPVVPVEGFEACPLEAWCASEVGAGFGKEVEEPSFDESSSSFPSLPRRSLERADDLLRL